MKNIFSANLLNERLTLITKENISEVSGEVKTVVKESKRVWGHVSPLKRVSEKHLQLVAGLEKNISNQIYRVIVRNPQEEGIQSFSLDRHKKINALIWKDREFELLFPFSIVDSSGRFLETLFVDKGE